MMKKIILSLVFMLSSMSTLFAQNEYVFFTMYPYSNGGFSVGKYGDIPSSMTSKSYGYNNSKEILTAILNDLSANGSYLVNAVYNADNTGNYSSILLTKHPELSSVEYVVLSASDFGNTSAIHSYLSDGYVISHASRGNYILCKTSTSASKISTAKADSNEEVTEVARYNLQGMPVTASDKGMQIIVYSNYTTKTVTVE